MKFLGILLFVIVYLIVEQIVHFRRLGKIGIRVHVNGSRGKSTVTELVAMGLRQEGIRTLAKTTGDHPILIYPDGRREQIHRRGPTRIQEQIAFVKKAYQLKANAIVVECMAIQPELQIVSETKMIKSAVGVITNVRPDHMGEMGENLKEIAESLSGTIPLNGILITADREFFPFFKQKAERLHTRTILVEYGLVDGREPDAPVEFFEENMALSEQVWSQLGLNISRNNLKIESYVSSTYNLNVYRKRIGSKAVNFIDAFSANDIVSVKTVQQKALNNLDCSKPLIALFNNRRDRPNRMRSYAAFFSTEPVYDYIFLVGDSKNLTKRCFDRFCSEKQIHVIKNKKPDQVLAEITRKIPSSECNIIGMGNYRGMGRKLSNFIKEIGEI
jgi:poly-gamma-glutamate synthase PgsB/CapB